MPGNDGKLDMKRARPTQRACRRGAAAVELALVAPFIFLFVFASFEFSHMMMIRQSLANAAREGSRHATLITTQSTTTSKKVVLDKLKGVIKHGDAIIKVNFSHANVSSVPPGTQLTTSVEVDCVDVSWMPPFFFAGAKIRGTSSMARE